MLTLGVAVVARGSRGASRTESGVTSAPGQLPRLSCLPVGFVGLKSKGGVLSMGCRGRGHTPPPEALPGFAFGSCAGSPRKGEERSLLFLHNRHVPKKLHVD